MFTYELQRRLAPHGTTAAVAAHPAALGGQYDGPGNRTETRGDPKVVTSSRASYDPDTQRRLWTVSEELTGVRFPLDAPPSS